jgi:hypothetical protein
MSLVKDHVSLNLFGDVKAKGQSNSDMLKDIEAWLE